MIYLTVTGGMTTTVLLFALGYALRFRNNLWHRRLMALGILINLLSAAILVYGIYLVHDGDARAAGFQSFYPPAFIAAHRLVAVFSAVLMLAMGITGALRLYLWHRCLQYFFIPLYLLVYASGLVLFFPV